MGFSESDSTKCRRHPNYKQLPGVCSSCLREKLSILSSTPSFRRSSGNWVPESYSLSSSPTYSLAGNHRRNGSEAYVSVAMVLNNGLKKSRSVSCAPLSRNRGVHFSNNVGTIKSGDKISSDESGRKLGFSMEEKDGIYKKKSGFLKRLINSTKKGGLINSKTMKERSQGGANMAVRNN